MTYTKEKKKRRTSAPIKEPDLSWLRAISLRNINSIVLFPLFAALLNRIPYLSLPEMPIAYFLGCIIFWYIFVETTVRKGAFFDLHAAYRLALYTVVSAGILVNSVIVHFISTDLLIYITPLFLTVAIVTILIGFEEGAGVGLFLAFIASATFRFSLDAFVMLSIISFVTALATRRLTARISIARAGFAVGAVFVALVFARSFTESAFNWIQLSAAFLNPVLSSIAVIGLLPYIEYATRIYSNVGLLELGNLSHPVLKNLSINAPGTYYHSVTLANLSEAASEAVGANPILARVGAYFHDVGKTKRPQYFTENQIGDNPHDRLSPSMSNTVINEHVQHGVELAKRHRLPLLVEDMVKQHHGTRHKLFFYRKAANRTGSTKREDFEYSGPKPQFPESGIVMLADSVEAAFKSLRNPTPGNIRETVAEVVEAIYNERQLDNSGLNLIDLEGIVDAFTRVLTSSSRPRIEYPQEEPESEVADGNTSAEQDGETRKREEDI